MEAKPTPTRAVPARAPLAAVPGRVRGAVRSAVRGIRGVLRRPLALRALVIGGLAVAGWLLGAGNAASAADSPGADGKSTVSNPVHDQVGQAGGLVHSGSDAVNRTSDSLDRSRLAKHDGKPTTSDPVRQKAGETGGLVHSGSDAVNRTTASLDRASMAKPAHGGQHGGQHGGHTGGHLTSGLAHHATGLLDHTGTTPRRPDVHRIAKPVTSMLDRGADKVGKSLPVKRALDEPSTAVDSVTHGVRPGGHVLPGPGHDQRADEQTGAPSHGTGAVDSTDARDRLTGGPGSSGELRPTFGRPTHPRMLCSHACGHGTHPHRHAPAAPAPTGPESDTHGLMPAPVSGFSLPGAGDMFWGTAERMPRHLSTMAPRRGVLPPVVRTAADEPALSPD